MNAEEQEKEDTFDGNAANLSEINYSKLTNTAIIEVHGCRVGSVEPEFNNINWAMIFFKISVRCRENKVGCHWTHNKSKSRSA